MRELSHLSETFGHAIRKWKHRAERKIKPTPWPARLALAAMPRASSRNPPDGRLPLIVAGWQACSVRARRRSTTDCQRSAASRLPREPRVTLAQGAESAARTALGTHRNHRHTDKPYTHASTHSQTASNQPSHAQELSRYCALISHVPRHQHTPRSPPQRRMEGPGPAQLFGMPCSPLHQVTHVGQRRPQKLFEPRRRGHVVSVVGAEP